MLSLLWEQDSEEAGERVCDPALVGVCFPKWGMPWRSLQHFLPVFLPQHLLKTPEGQVRPQSYSLQRSQAANVFISSLSFCRAKKQLIPGGGGGGGDWSTGLCQWAGSRECGIWVYYRKGRERIVRAVSLLCSPENIFLEANSCHNA